MNHSIFFKLRNGTQNCIARRTICLLDESLTECPKKHLKVLLLQKSVYWNNAIVVQLQYSLVLLLTSKEGGSGASLVSRKKPIPWWQWVYIEYLALIIDNAFSRTEQEGINYANFTYLVGPQEWNNFANAHFTKSIEEPTFYVEHM